MIARKEYAEKEQVKVMKIPEKLGEEIPGLEVESNAKKVVVAGLVKEIEELDNSIEEVRKHVTLTENTTFTDFCARFDVENIQV